MIHPEVREWLHEIRKTDRATAALIGQAIQHVIDVAVQTRGDRWWIGSKAAGCTT